MEEKIIGRLFTYLQSKDIPHTRFEKIAGLSNGYLKTQLRRNGDLGEGIINSIIENCLDISLIWLLTGEGEMIKENVTPKCNPNVSPQTIDNVTPIVTPIQKNDFTDNNNLHTQNAHPECTPKTMSMHAQSDAQSAHSNSVLHFEHTPHDDALKVCQACIEKDNMIVMLKDFIKSKDETINAKNEAVIALNKALIAKDEALIAKDEAIRSKNELIEELLQKDDLDFDDMPVSSAS